MAEDNRLTISIAKEDLTRKRLEQMAREDFRSPSNLARMLINQEWERRQALKPQVSISIDEAAARA